MTGGMSGHDGCTSTEEPPSNGMGRFDPWPIPLVAARRRLARHLHGTGIELGPGHQPFEVPDDLTVRFVDRWVSKENRALFPELVEIGADDGFIEPDIVANFDTDRLRPIESASVDFVICSHVLEHLAEPIGFLAEIHRVLRPGGVVLLLLPDRRMTFDRDRPPTSLEHLVSEHEAGVTEVSDVHLIEFLTLAGEGASFLGVPDDADERRHVLDWHRERSIHVHCWSEREFPAVLAHCIDSLGQRWHLVDLLTVAEEGPSGIEFGYVLHRSSSEHPDPGGGARFLADWEAWFADDLAIGNAIDVAARLEAPAPAGDEPAPRPVPERTGGLRQLLSRWTSPSEARRSAR